MVVNDKLLAPLVLSPEKEENFHSGHSEKISKGKGKFHPRTCHEGPEGE
jgi:hypothetical protein